MMTIATRTLMGMDLSRAAEPRERRKKVRLNRRVFCAEDSRFGDCHHIQANVEAAGPAPEDFSQSPFRAVSLRGATDLSRSDDSQAVLASLVGFYDQRDKPTRRAPATGLHGLELATAPEPGVRAEPL
jgi:hypothetical protein